MDALRKTLDHLASWRSITMSIPTPRELLWSTLLFPTALLVERTPLSRAPACVRPQLSCHNTSAVADTCCFNYPSGQFLQTQFWDYNTALGPSNSWTIHGLWPDHCHGGFDQYCDSDRQYTDVSNILSSFPGTTDLLEYMQTYWLANHGSHERLWSHEWNKHGTCISTLDPHCYGGVDGNAQPQHRDVLDYFNTTVSIFKALETYTFLANAGIVPTKHTTYSLSHLQKVLHQAHGAPVVLRCQGSTLNELWYTFAVRGSVQTGDFVPSVPSGIKSNCPANGIKYIPKQISASPTRTSSSFSTSSPTAAPIPFSGKGHLHISVISPPSPVSQRHTTHDGCLISTGHWYDTSGSGCATFTVQNDTSDPTETEHFFTLTSRRGTPCSVNEIGAFECSKSLPFQTIFSVDGHKMSFRNETKFYATKIPERYEKVEVFADDGGEDETREVQIEIVWQSS